MLENSAHAARAEDFGLRMSEPRRLSALGPLALAVRDAGTLREALQSACRYLCLHTDSLVLSLKEMDNTAMPEIGPLTEGNAPSRQGTELAIDVFYRAIRELPGNSPNGWQVWFPHTAPKNISKHNRVFGPQIEFGLSVTGLRFARRDLDKPLPAAGPVMAQQGLLEAGRAVGLVGGQQHAVRSHRRTQTAGRDAVPNADLGQTSAARGMAGETIALGRGCLRLGP